MNKLYVFLALALAGNVCAASDMLSLAEFTASGKGCRVELSVQGNDASMVSGTARFPRGDGGCDVAAWTCSTNSFYHKARMLRKCTDMVPEMPAGADVYSKISACIGGEETNFYAAHASTIREMLKSGKFDNDAARILAWAVPILGGGHEIDPLNLSGSMARSFARLDADGNTVWSFQSGAIENPAGAPDDMRAALGKLMSFSNEVCRARIEQSDGIERTVCVIRFKSDSFAAGEFEVRHIFSVADEKGVAHEKEDLLVRCVWTMEGADVRQLLEALTSVENAEDIPFPASDGSVEVSLSITAGEKSMAFSVRKPPRSYFEASPMPMIFYVTDEYIPCSPFVAGGAGVFANGKLARGTSMRLIDFSGISGRPCFDICTKAIAK